MNLRVIKKDIEYFVGEFIDDCTLFAALNPDKNNEDLAKIIDEAVDLYNNLKDKVELGGTFCMGKCQQGVCVTVDDAFFSLTPESTDDFFAKEILAKVK